jgi:hypothetical protein
MKNEISIPILNKFNPSLHSCSSPNSDIQSFRASKNALLTGFKTEKENITGVIVPHSENRTPVFHRDEEISDDESFASIDSEEALTGKDECTSFYNNEIIFGNFHAINGNFNITEGVFAFIEFRKDGISHIEIGNLTTDSIKTGSWLSLQELTHCEGKWNLRKVTSKEYSEEGALISSSNSKNNDKFEFKELDNGAIALFQMNDDKKQEGIAIYFTDTYRMCVCLDVKDYEIVHGSNKMLLRYEKLTVFKSKHNSKNGDSKKNINKINGICSHLDTENYYIDFFCLDHKVISKKTDYDENIEKINKWKKTLESKKIFDKIMSDNLPPADIGDLFIHISDDEKEELIDFLEKGFFCYEEYINLDLREFLLENLQFYFKFKFNQEKFAGMQIIGTKSEGLTNEDGAQKTRSQKLPRN